MINGERVGKGLANTANHQRTWKRPWLGGEITDRAGFDAGLLLQFAPDGAFHGLARLDETGKARIHARRETGLATENAFVAPHSHHDGDGVGAWEVLGLA